MEEKEMIRKQRLSDLMELQCAIYEKTCRGIKITKEEIQREKDLLNAYLFQDWFIEIDGEKLQAIQPSDGLTKIINKWIK